MFAINYVMLIYQGQNTPLNRRLINNIELFNEWAIMACSVLFICFTDFVDDLEMQQNMGWSFLAIILLTIIINLYYVFGVAFY